MLTRVAGRVLGCSLLPLLLLACDGATEPQDGLAPGTYEASLTLGPSSGAPVALVGDHEFSFRVDDPKSASGFTLLTSRFRDARFGEGQGGWRAGYLAPSTEHVVAGADEWHLRWEVREYAEAFLEVEMTGVGPGHRTEACGLLLARESPESYPAGSCDVELVETSRPSS